MSVSRVDVVDDARDDVALALDCADDRHLARADAASPAALAALVLVPVLGLAADEGLVNLDDAHELAEILVGEAGADAMAHVPSGVVRAEAHHAMNLKGADALLAGQHQVDDAEPLAQRLIGVLEDRADQICEKR